jgi:hypothetical protein
MDRLLERLKKRGLEVIYDHEYVDTADGRVKRDKATIYRIRVPLSAKEWCALCMRDGEDYLGGCCGQTGQIQDVMNDIFRDSGVVDTSKAHQLKEISASHEGFEAFEKTEDELLVFEATWDELWSGEKVTLCCAAAISKMRDPLRGPRTVDPKNTDDIIDVLARGASYIDFKNMFADKEETPEWKMGQVHGHSAIMVAKMVPAAQQFLKLAPKVVKFPFRGFAIVDKKREIVVARMGLVIAYKEKELEKILAGLRQDEKEREYSKDFKVVPVRITIEKGVEIL